MKNIIKLLVLALVISITHAKESGNSGALIAEDAKVGDIIHQDILEDVELLSFLKELKSSIKNHNWSAFIGMCSNEHYQAQVNTMRMSTTQYIAEAIGVHNQGNNIFEAGESKVDMKVLEKIKDIKFLSIQKHYNEITIKGELLLKNGQKLQIEIMGLYDTDDGYVISGALG